MNLQTRFWAKNSIGLRAAIREKESARRAHGQPKYCSGYKQDGGKQALCSEIEIHTSSSSRAIHAYLGVAREIHENICPCTSDCVHLRTQDHPNSRHRHISSCPEKRILSQWSSRKGPVSLLVPSLR